MSQGKERTVALGHVASMFAEGMAARERETIEQQLDRSAVEILSILPDFIEAQHALDDMQTEEEEHGRRVPRREKMPHKEVAIAFNHTLRELIDTAPDISADEVTRFMSNAMLDLGDPSEADYCARETRVVLYGIQHEIGLEQILWNIEGVEDIAHGTSAQELEGGDLIVTYRGTDIFLDAKASDRSAKKSLQHRQEFLHRNNLTEATARGGYPVWTGLTAADFKGGFRISEELASERAPYFESVLDQLYTQRSQTA